MKTELTTQICQEMNAKFMPYGVYIDQVNIMYIVLPIDMRQVLTGTTVTDVQLQR